MDSSNLYKIVRYKKVNDNQYNLEEIINELKKSEDLNYVLKLIIQNSLDGIFITDSNGIAIMINPAYERITGLKIENMLGRHHNELIKDGLIKQSSALMAMEQRKEVTVIHRFPAENREALVTSNPVFDENGKVFMIVSNARDLTVLNELNEQLEKERERSLNYQKQLESLKITLSENINLIAEDEKMLNLLTLAKRVSQVDSPILLTGESGVGKDEFAKFIHQYSPRNKAPFIAVNCGALPENLVESELFGYEAGSFSGALSKGKIGLIEAANTGVLFLDEIGDLPLDSQVKLLRVLQNKRITRVGGIKEISVDIRLISATNHNIQQMIKERKFREDLFYRISVLPINIPPLRERLDDIVPLAKHFLNELNLKYGMKKAFSKNALISLLRYSWPGNVRELKNIVERVAVTTSRDTIIATDFPMIDNVKFDNALLNDISLQEYLEKLEYTFIQKAYNEHKSIRKAAQSLRMKPSTYARKKNQYFNLYGDSN